MNTSLIIMIFDRSMIKNEYKKPTKINKFMFEILNLFGWSKFRS